MLRIMPPLKNLSRKAIVATALMVWFGPSLFLLMQLSKNGTPALQRVLVLPLMYGFTMTMWLRALLQDRHWFFWVVSVVFALGLPAMLVGLMLRSSRWRPAILTAGLIFSVALTVAAYWLLRA